jgi:hypothetical protein
LERVVAPEPAPESEPEPEVEEAPGMPLSFSPTEYERKHPGQALQDGRKIATLSDEERREQLSEVNLKILEQLHREVPAAQVKNYFSRRSNIILLYSLGMLDGETSAPVVTERGVDALKWAERI